MNGKRKMSHLVILIIFTLLSNILLTGCGETADDQNRKSTSNMIIVEEQANKNFPFLVTEYGSTGDILRQSQFNKYGNSEPYSLYEYDSKGNVQKQTLFGLYSLEYEYENGQLVKQYTHYFNNQDDYWSTMEYDKAGNQTRTNKFNTTGELIGWLEAERDSDGNVVKITNYNMDGSGVGWTDLRYDSAGHTISQIAYDQTGKVIWRVEDEYNDIGDVEKHSIYSGSILTSCQWVEYEYDTNWHIAKKTTYCNGSVISSNGMAQYWDEFEYDSNGKEQKQSHYDAFGNLIYWCTFEYGSNGNPENITFYTTRDVNIWDLTN